MEYSGVNAKIKAMRSHLLDAGDYGALCSAPSVEGVAERLRSYPPYAAALNNLTGVGIHRGMVEQSLMISLAEDFRRIYNFIGDFRIRRYLSALFLNFEIGIVKKLLCMVYDERDIGASMSEVDRLLGSELKIDITKLKNSKSVSEFIQSLKGTGMYSMLADNYSADRSLYEIEAQLDLYYYMNLNKCQRRWLNDSDRQAMDEVKGVEVDLRNIMWVWRLKKYYNVPDMMIYAHLIPISHKLKRASLMRMVQSKSLTELLGEIGNSPYGSVFSSMEGLELSYYREMSRVHLKSAAMHPNSLAVTASFLHAKELETNNIVSILEGVRYKLNPADIMSYLNLSREMEVR